MFGCGVKGVKSWVWCVRKVDDGGDGRKMYQPSSLSYWDRGEIYRRARGGRLCLIGCCMAF
jgi:hypothetical protein